MRIIKNISNNNSILFLIMSVGVLLFLIASFNLYFPNSWLNSLYPKPFSFAVTENQSAQFLEEEIRGVELNDLLEGDDIFAIDGLTQEEVAEKNGKIEEAFYAIKNLGYNTVRLSVPLKNFTPTDDNAAINELVLVLQLAEQQGLKVWLSFYGLPSAHYFKVDTLRVSTNSLFLTQDGADAVSTVLQDIFVSLKKKISLDQLVAIDPFKNPVLKTTEWPFTDKNLVLTSPSFLVERAVSMKEFISTRGTESDHFKQLLSTSLPQVYNRWREVVREHAKVPVSYEYTPNALLSSDEAIYQADDIPFLLDNDILVVNVDIARMPQTGLSTLLPMEDNDSLFKLHNKPVIFLISSSIKKNNTLSEESQIKAVSQFMVDSCKVLPMNSLQRGWLFSPWQSNDTSKLSATSVTNGKRLFDVGYRLSPKFSGFSPICPE